MTLLAWGRAENRSGLAKFWNAAATLAVGGEMEKKRSTLTWALTLPKSDLLGSLNRATRSGKVCSRFFFRRHRGGNSAEWNPSHPGFVILLLCVFTSTHENLLPFSTFFRDFLKLPLDVRICVIFAKVLMQKTSSWSFTKAGICSTDIYRWSHSGLECSGHRKPSEKLLVSIEEINFFLYT